LNFERITLESAMARYRNHLPQLGSQLFLTDGGIETTLIFLEGLELPDFAAFDLLQSAEGAEALRKYFRTYASIARKHGAGFVLESPTWRANPDWAKRLGYSPEGLATANRKAIELLENIRREFETDRTPMVISGCVGPRGDGYVPGDAMSAEQAEAYHSEQIRVFASTAADMICAVTMNYSNEATGVTRAAKNAGMPVAISFTVETDGKLPTGQNLESAIGEVDGATSGYASYFMINCAHPTHFDHLFAGGGEWQKRIKGLRANASRRSHAELNEAPDLDDGNPQELGVQYAELARRLPGLNVMGGCCGTDHRHLESIASACAAEHR
jgi:S-methylmethionine-dependent homocysteine/selenocysteine methylase